MNKWTIESTERIYNPTVNVGCNGDNVRERLLELSLRHPELTLTLTVAARVRARVKNGKFLKETTFQDFYIVNERMDYINAIVFNEILNYPEFLDDESLEETEEWSEFTDEQLKERLKL